MKRKLAMLLTTVLAVGTVLTGCGGINNAEGVTENVKSANGGEKETVTIWSWDVALMQMQDAAAKYQETHSNVEFVFEEMGTEQIYKKLSTSLATGNGIADIISIEGEVLSGYATKFPEGFLDLTDAVKADDFLDVKMGEVNIGGKIHAFPWDAGPMALFYRTDYFEQAEVKAEEIVTWNDYIEAGKKVTATCKTPSGEPVKMLPIAPTGSSVYRMLGLELGTSFFDKDGNTVVNSQESVQAMDMMKEIYDAGITLNYNGWDEYEGTVVNQSVATIPEAVWMIGTIKDKGAETAGKWGVMELPKFTPDGSAGATNGGAVAAINAKSEVAETAKDFLTFALTDKQLLADGFVKYGLYPSYIPSYDNEIFKGSEEFFGGQKIYEIFIESGKDIPAINFTENFAEALDASGTAVSKVLLKGEDVKLTLDALQEEMVTKFGK